MALPLPTASTGMLKHEPSSSQTGIVSLELVIGAAACSTSPMSIGSLFPFRYCVSSLFVGSMLAYGIQNVFIFVFFFSGQVLSIVSKMPGNFENIISSAIILWLSFKP